MTKRLKPEEKALRLARTAENYRQESLHNAEPLTLEKLKQYIHYNPETGIFVWLRTTTQRVKLGGVVGSKMANGYLDTCVCGRRFLLHRLAWWYMTGEMPVGDIDHIDGVRANNRFSNLRDVSRSTNLENQRNPKTHNKSGFLGVTPDPRKPGWFVAQIGVNGKRIHLGRHGSAEAAHMAYIEAKRRLHKGNTL